MDNYKIKVKDEASADEARDLFKKLGYHPDNSSYEPYVEWVAVFEDGSGSFYSHNMNLGECVEITIAQLRDLVVLKRNDSRDANVNQVGEIPCLYDLYLTADKELYFYHCGKGKWLLSNLNHDEDYYATLKPIEKSEPQDPALISGAEALRALADGKGVEYSHEEEPYGRWTTISNFEEYSLDYFLAKNTKFKFRIKPQTIKLELELPKPFEPKEGEKYYLINPFQEDGYDSYVFDVDNCDHIYTQFGAYRTETEVKQVVEQLRKIRGTNS
ncbi:hypothetical protein [Acinetobacter baumannii]|uniref:hypothetical protein n=1 Tax=Acinetobacter baumannii TaxID=470 RepID=UPI002948CBA1|nr:hypothetical protein [Acinetobacter baumannii]MDV5701847.1 hypothetical protein [Acinetobacter baumannii]